MAESTLLSQSLMQGSQDSKLLRDPFAQAKNKYESSQSSPQTLLSSSPFNSSPAPALNPSVQPNLGSSLQGGQAPDQGKGFGSMLDKLGINSKAIAMNQIGRIQLIGRLREKFGEGYAQNSDALGVLSSFDQQVQESGEDSQKSFNSSMSNSERTLKALFGGA